MVQLHEENCFLTSAYLVAFAVFILGGLLLPTSVGGGKNKKSKIMIAMLALIIPLMSTALMPESKTSNTVFNLTIATFNLCRAHSEGKCSILAQTLKSANIHILAVQEISSIDLHIRDYYYLKNYNVTENTGVGFLVRADIEVSDVYKAIDGRSYAIQFAGLTIFTAYMESGTKVKLQREASFQNLTVNIYCHQNPNLIVLGDMNAVYDCTATTAKDNYSPAFKQMTECLKLTDAWDHFFPHVPLYTYMNNSCKSKLDYILLSPLMVKAIKSVKTEKLAMSDHTMVQINVKWNVPLFLRKSYWWRLNADFVAEPAFCHLTAALKQTTNSYSGKSGEEWKVWRRKKNTFIREYKLYTRVHYEDKKRTIEFYQAVLQAYNQRAMQDLIWLPKVRKMQSKLRQLMSYRYKGLQNEIL